MKVLALDAWRRKVVLLTQSHGRTSWKLFDVLPSSADPTDTATFMTVL